jgi:hypothetical protein
MKVYKYSWLKSLPKYASLYNDSLIGEDPLVFIEETNDGKTYISLYNISNDAIFQTPESKKSNLFDFMYNNTQAKIKGVSSDNIIGNIKAISLSLLAQHINKVSDKNIYIKDAGVIQFTPGGSTEVWIDPVKFANDMRILANDKQFMSMLDNDIFKNIFDIKSLKSLHVDYDSLLLSTYNKMEYKPYYMQDYFDKREDKTDEEKKQLFKARLKELMGKKGVTDLSIDEVNEITMLFQTLLAYNKTTIVDMTLSSNREMSAMDKLIQPGFDIDNEVIIRIREKVLDVSNKIVDEFNSFKKDWFNKDIVKWFINRYEDKNSLALEGKIIKELTSKYYSELFVTVKDSNNNPMNNGYIYWTKDTKEDILHAKDAQNIDNEVLAKGRKIVDAVTDMYTRLLLHNRIQQGRLYLDDNKKWQNYDYKRAKWELLNKTAYRPGMLPVMSMTVGELMSSGKLGDAWKKKSIQITDVYMMYDDFAGLNNSERESMDRLQDMFFYQIGLDSPKNTIYGSQGRMELLGISQDKDGKWLVDDIKKNVNMSKDIETLISYFVMSGLRTVYYEDEVLPLTNAAKIYLYDLENNKGVDMKNVNSMIDLIIEGPIKGKRKMTKAEIAGIKIDPTISTFQSVFGTIALFGNINVGIVSGLINGMKGFIEGIANSIVDRGLPSAKELVQASTLFFSDYKKATQLAQMFRVCNMSEYELLTSRRHIKGKRHVWSEHIGHWFNWSTDMYARSVMMVAQMLKDGSWDAYTYNNETGKIEYDESKDKRFAGEDGKIIREEVRRQLILEGNMKPEDKKLTRGYDNKSMRKFKALGDKYIVGAYDDKTKSMLGQYMIGRMVNMFHTYLTSMIQNAFQKRTAINELGKYVVVLDENGEKVAEWERLFVEGYVITIVNYIKSLYTYLRTGDKEYLKLDKLGRYNMTKVATMLSMYLILILLYKGLVDERGDKDDDDDPIREYRLIQNFKYATTGLFTAPQLLEIIDDPWPVLSMIKRLYQDRYGNIKLENAVNVLPGATTVETLIEPFEETNQ